ncbi:MAG: hypothetical protein ACM31D_06260 [Bacteroidota bacterium]
MTAAKERGNPDFSVMLQMEYFSRRVARPAKPADSIKNDVARILFYRRFCCNAQLSL